MTLNNSKYLKILDINIAMADAQLANANLDKYVKKIYSMNMETVGSKFDPHIPTFSEWLQDEKNGLGHPIVVIEFQYKTKWFYKYKIKDIVKNSLKNFVVLKSREYLFNSDEVVFFLSTKTTGGVNIKRNAYDSGRLI